MNRKEDIRDLTSFFDNVLEPSESFARLCADSDAGSPSFNTAKGGFEDFGIVAGALTTLSRRQLHDFAEKLQTHVGEVEVAQTSCHTISAEIGKIIIKDKLK
ncbi:MAG: hypothetical protein LBC55_03415 [Desulfovibrio sp.]|nr:hypothetical protein [Desulfovibrio sp.]